MISPPTSNVIIILLVCTSQSPQQVYYIHYHMSIEARNYSSNFYIYSTCFQLIPLGTRDQGTAKKSRCALITCGQY